MHEDTPFSRLVKRLSLREHSDDVFLGGSGEGGVTANARLFGGLVAAQAAMAAQKTVDASMPMHSLHAYFLLPGRAGKDIEYRVTRSKTGKRFHVRDVVAWQGDAQIFKLQASFQLPEAGVAHQPVMPEVPDPANLPNRDELRGRANWRDMPIDVRMVNEITGDTALPAEQAVWIRASHPLPDESHLHLAFLVYASDRSLLDTAWRPHADRGRLGGASLDHTIWFHQPPRLDDWLLYDMTSPVAGAGRGLAFGHFYNQAGQCIATVAQEGLLRVLPE